MCVIDMVRGKDPKLQRFSIAVPCFTLDGLMGYSIWQGITCPAFRDPHRQARCLAESLFPSLFMKFPLVASKTDMLVEVFHGQKALSAERREISLSVMNCFPFS